MNGQCQVQLLTTQPAPPRPSDRGAHHLTPQVGDTSGPDPAPSRLCGLALPALSPSPRLGCWEAPGYIYPTELQALPSLQPQLNCAVSARQEQDAVGRPRLGGRDIPVSCPPKHVRIRPAPPACLPAESGLRELACTPPPISVCAPRGCPVPLTCQETVSAECWQENPGDKGKFTSPSGA